MKTAMLGELAEQELLLPTLVNEALAANERAKYLLTLLQTAVAWARAPAGPAPTLRRERLAAGLDDPVLDAVVPAARAVDGGAAVPGAAGLVRRLVDEVRTMMGPLTVAQPAAAAGLEARLAAVGGPPTGDTIAGDDLRRLTSGRREDGDSVHLVVMDAHQALNQLQAALATESVAGARCYGLDDGSRRLVAAFMAGVNRTAPLKFDHPGLGTTATRSGARLVLQNDIGTSDVHLFVLHVDGLAATLTYSDLHAVRVAFFRDLLRPFAVEWTDGGARTAGFATPEGGYTLCTGTFRAADEPELQRFLEHVGSRLVFLIDWNRARKRLRPFVGKREAVDVRAGRRSRSWATWGSS